MLITLRELELHRISVSKTYPPDVLDLQGSGFRQKGPVRVDAVAELVEREIRIRGHVSARLESSCDRCLGRVEFPVESDFDLLYRPMTEIARECGFGSPSYLSACFQKRCKMTPKEYKNVG